MSFKPIFFRDTLFGLIGIGFAVTVVAAPAAPEPPQVPFKYSLGVNKYQNSCAKCHGKWAQGTDSGPPLIHPFYKPSHHPDRTFYRAVNKGVQAHHWNFGDMPPVAGLSNKDVAAIVEFVRWLQRDRGLYKE